MKQSSLLLSLSLVSANGFLQISSFRKRPSSKVFVSEPTASSEELNVDKRRRNLLLSSSLLVIAAPLVAQNSNIKELIASPVSSTAKMTVDQAVEIIETSCDRRFLHAVVASDYHFLYKEASTATNQIYIESGKDNIVVSSIMAAKDLEALEGKLQDRPLQPSASRLGFANPKDVNSNNKDVTSIVWPLGENVHFAWMEQGTSFESIREDDNVIVDGVDCGRMALEDALEGGKQVIFQSEQYLSVPRSMEKELLTKLQSAFII
jgi:hypothetical protein